MNSFPRTLFSPVSNVTNSTALTFQNKHINQHLVVQSDEGLDAGANPETGTIHTQDALLPHYEITLFPIQLWSPAKSTSTLDQVLHPNHLGLSQFSANGATEEYYSRLDGLTRERTNAADAHQPISLSRNWSLTPSVSSTLNWQDKYDPFTSPTTSTTTYLPIGVSAATKVASRPATISATGPVRILTLDQTYGLTGRMRPTPSCSTAA